VIEWRHEKPVRKSHGTRISLVGRSAGRARRGDDRIEAKHAGIYHLDEQERLAIRRGLQELRDGKLATDEMVAEVFDRYRRA
jgi:hypothetical protein